MSVNKLYEAMKQDLNNKMKKDIEKARQRFQYCIFKIDDLFSDKFDRDIIRSLKIQEDSDIGTFDMKICSYPNIDHDFMPELEDYIVEKNKLNKFDKIYTKKISEPSKIHVYINIEFLNKDYIKILKKDYGKYIRKI